MNADDTRPVRRSSSSSLLAARRLSMVTLVPQHNRLGRHDATGAFQPEAARFTRLWESRGEVVLGGRIDNLQSKQTMRESVIAQLQGARDLRCVAFFCHGLRSSIQFGFGFAQAPQLARALVTALRPEGVVALYACDSARDDDRQQEDDLQPGPGGEGGFADTLADEMRKLGWCGWIDAHAVSGHTTINRFVRRFRGSDDGGTWIIEPDSGAQFRAWGNALRETDLRVEFPLLTEREIRARFDGGAR